MKARYLPPLAALLGLSACVVDKSSFGPVEYSSESVDLDNSEEVRVELRMGAGDLRVSDGAQKLLRGDFSFNRPSWKPEVHYTRDGNRGSLSIHTTRHQSHGPDREDLQYRWDLQLSNKVPLDLIVHFGAGQARLDLGSLMLRGVELDMGVGQLDMDLRGKVRHSYNVNIRGVWDRRPCIFRWTPAFTPKLTAGSAASTCAACAERETTGSAILTRRQRTRSALKYKAGSARSS